MSDSNAVSGGNFVVSRAATSATATKEPSSKTGWVGLGRLEPTLPEQQEQAEERGEGVELAMASRAATSATAKKEPSSKTGWVGLGRLEPTLPEPQKQAEKRREDLIQRKFPSTLKLSLGGITVFIFAWLIISCINWVKSTYEYSMILGGFATASILIALLGFSYLIITNYRDLRRLKKSQLASVDENKLTRAEDLAKSDEEATKIVKRTVKQVLFIPLISPIPLIATVFFMVLGIRMVRGIAVAYGHRPSMFVMIYLLRRIFLEAAAFGAVDVVLQGMIGNIGNFFGKIIAKELSEGAYISLRTARLGKITMSCCRPVKFSLEEQRNISLGLRDFVELLWKKEGPEEGVDQKKSEVPVGTSSTFL